ncbi:MAG: hypothetical protein EA406_05095 [Rhodospirillales bacterium]|nr:MAG: hypothetical protein EA406_05095 [Rhodospirillales bacterium]
MILGRWIAAWLLVAVGIALAVGTLPARAATSDPAASEWVHLDYSAVRLVAATTALGDGDRVPLGLHIRLADGWKTYWRSPGDAGLPADADWSASENLAAAEFAWPAPRRYTLLGLETLGYEGEVVLPVTARPARPDAPMSVRATVHYLICEDICIPQTAELSLTVPPGPAAPSAFAHLIGRYQNRVPGSGDDVGLTIDSIAFGREREGAALVVRAGSTGAPFGEPDVFIESPDQPIFAKPRVRLTDDGHGAVFTIPAGEAGAVAPSLAGAAVTVTLVDGERAMEGRFTVAEAEVGGLATGTTLPLSWIAVLGLAVVGGLILNLMPCVLPVLSIKLLSVVGHGGGPARPVRLGFLAAAAGIVFSFLVLAGALAALKAGGAVIGWGIQFQQPWFLITMTLVVSLFAGNLWGVFAVRLPGAIADAGARLGHGQGLGGHFLTGALATLLATPCSAPFLGTAVGFALAQGTFEIFAVLTAVGIGLALPYLAVAAFPRLATSLPRPGRWMIILRRVLGFALAGTAVWLLSVLAAQVGVVAAAVVGLVAAAAVLAVGGATRMGRPWGRRGAAAAAIGLAAVAFLVPARFASDAAAAADAAWQPLDEAAIAAHVAAGQVVYVNVTADWCITCKVNETLVLNSRDVRAWLAQDEVVAMRGDWTRPNDDIARFLARFGRYGIPFDAVFGPALPDGAALPELLTVEAVRGGLDRARADTVAAGPGDNGPAAQEPAPGDPIAGADAVTGFRR